MDTVLVGSEVPRVDGLAKVTGKAVYGDDITMNNMLYGVCRYVDIPAGRIDSLDLSEAEKVPGVVRPASANWGRLFPIIRRLLTRRSPTAATW